MSLSTLPNKLNLTLEQGATFEKAFKFSNPDGTVVSLTGCSFAGQIRATYSDPIAAADFEFDKSAAILGIVGVSVPETVTAAMPPGNYVYDIIRTDAAGKATKPVWGNLVVMPGVTR